MAAEQTDTVVVGGGQAGLAMSEHLRNNGIAHLVLEKDRIGERWRTARWDSLVANGPAWHDCFASMDFEGIDPDGFATRDQVVHYLESYARRIDAPVRAGVRVDAVIRHVAKPGFRVETSAGLVHANNVVAATGPFQQPMIPPLVPGDSPVMQLHSRDYRNPEQLPPGAVLVVGSGSSGVQIADELQRAGRTVFLSVGPHDRPPRRYRGRDYCWWLGVLGKWDLATPDPNTAHVTIAVSGARGGETIDFRRLAHQGITLLGMTQGFDNGVLSFADDLARNIARGDHNYLSMLDEADNYIARNGMALPPEPEARRLPDDPDCLRNPVRSLDIASHDINAIVWATGYTQDFGWLQVDAFDPDGKPDHRRGVSREAGVYFLGLPWLSRRGSSFIWGVWHDAKYLADHISTQQRYRQYPGSGG